MAQSTTVSFLRREQYKALSQLSIDGSILDVGGSKTSGYHELIGGTHEITVGNIDASYGIDIEFDAEQAWPFPAATFDGVLFVNLLEHLYKYEHAVREAARVLKTEGTLAGVVPFMFHVHGAPNDYFRYTKSALERVMGENGFGEIEVRELGTGGFSIIYHCLLGFMHWHWLASLLMPAFGGIDKLLFSLKPDNKISATHMPLGYYFEAKRL